MKSQYGKYLLFMVSLFCFIVRQAWVVFSVVLGNFSEFHSSVQAGGLLAWKSVLREVAGQSLLVELGSLATDKAVLVHSLNVSVVVINWVANMEDLAGIVYISIVAVSSILLVTVKTIVVRGIKKVGRTSGKPF